MKDLETICSYGKTKESPNDILCNNHSDWIHLALDQWKFIILNNFGTNTYKQSRPDLFGRFGDKLISHFGLSRTFLSAFLAALKGNYRPFSIFIGNLPMADDNLNPWIMIWIVRLLFHNTFLFLIIKLLLNSLVTFILALYMHLIKYKKNVAATRISTQQIIKINFSCYFSAEFPLLFLSKANEKVS